MNPARTILGVLQKDSEVLFEIMEDFVGKTAKLQLVSFFEMKMTSFGIFKRMVYKTVRSFNASLLYLIYISAGC